MIFLSRLPLNPRSRQVRRDLSDVHELHRTVMSAYPQASGDAREKFAVLYRLDLKTSERPVILVQSVQHPDWTSLPAGYLVPGGPEIKEIGSTYEALRLGQRVMFRLHANPTRRLNNGPPGQRTEKLGARVDVRGEQQQLEWLRRKGEQNGFELLQVTAGGDESDAARSGVPAVDVRPNGRVTGEHGKLTFGAVTFDGLLQVNEPGRFRAALKEGIGSGKAYGFGLLSIAPAP